MEEYDARYAVSVYSCKLAALPFRHFYEPDAEKDEQKKRRRTAEKAPFFAYGTVDEVRVLLGYEVVLGLCPLQKALAEKPAATDCYFALVDIVADSFQILFLSQQNFYPVFLMLLQAFLECHVDCKDYQ